MDANEQLYDIMKLYGAQYPIGQRVVYQGKEDEIEAFCPLWSSELRGKKWEQKYIGMGYNLKVCRRTVMGDEFLIPVDAIPAL